VQLLELLYRARPGGAPVHVRVYDQCRVRERVDQLVALRDAFDVEARAPIVGRQEQQFRLRVDGGMLIACSNSITVLDSWGSEPRNIPDPIDGLWSSDASQDWIYWIERDAEGTARVGYVPWHGDAPAVMYPLPESGGDVGPASGLNAREVEAATSLACWYWKDTSRRVGAPSVVGGVPYEVGQHWMVGQDSSNRIWFGTSQSDDNLGE
jgi:hypothetical protein